MARQYTVTEYDKDDIEKLDFMEVDEVIETLEHIKRGWLPQDYVCYTRDFETYTESQYDTTKLHKAMGKAIELLQEVKEAGTRREVLC